MSSIGVMQRLEMSVDRRLLAGMVARAVGASDDADGSQRRLGRSATRASWFRYGGTRPCSTRNAMTAILKSTRCGRRSQCRVARASDMVGRKDVVEISIRGQSIQVSQEKNQITCRLFVGRVGEWLLILQDDCRSTTGHSTELVIVGDHLHHDSISTFAVMLQYSYIQL